jgi:hypothetical protein
VPHAIICEFAPHRCTWLTSQVRELSYIHSRDVTYAVLCQGPYEESARYRKFMGWEMPWYSAKGSLDTLLDGGRAGMFHLVCYLRLRSDVFETYWTTGRGGEALDLGYDLLDMTVYGRQESRGKTRRPAGRGGSKARMPCVRMDVLPLSCPVWRPGIPTTWELASAEPSLPCPRSSDGPCNEIGFDLCSVLSELITTLLHTAPPFYVIDNSRLRCCSDGISRPC